MAIAGASEIFAANELTINPVSTVALFLIWGVAGAGIGFCTGWLGGRAATIARRPFGHGALALSLVTTGHLFLPTGVGLLAGGLAWLLRSARCRWKPRAPRLDGLIALALAAAATTLPRFEPALPPQLAPGTELDAGTPSPGSVPVTISLHGPAGFPEVPALHLPLRALDSGLAGRRSTVFTGRLPDRTRAGRGTPRLLPGGGGLSRIPPWPGVELLAHWLPTPESTDGTVFAPVGTIAELAEAAGIPVLTGSPSPDDPPHFLRILESDSAPSTEQANLLRGQGAWIDVTLDERGGTVAFSGRGLVLAQAQGEVTLADVAPTALHLMGLGIPRAMDGRVLLELLRQPGPADRPPRYRALATSASTRSR